MTEDRKRKVHSAEFKAKVGMEAVRGMKTLNEIGQQYGVQPCGGVRGGALSTGKADRNF